MEILTQVCWGLLALLHLAPAAILVSPGIARKLYGVDPEGDVGVLLIHRGALFLGVALMGFWAVMGGTDVRRLASVVTALSMISFIAIYARAGWRAGPLRSIAIADLIGVVPLSVVAWSAWW